MQPEASETIEQQGPAAAVVIVVNNQRDALVRCLRSLEASTIRQRMEIIVVDSGSGDGSGRVDEEFEQITVLRLPRDFGKSRARNIGVRTAKADLLLFTDPRVEFDPASVERMVDALERDEQAAAATPEFRTPEGQRVSCSLALPDSVALREASLGGGALPASDGLEAIADWAFLLRKPVLKGMNGFDEKRFSEFWAELEVCWQIRNAGKRIVEAAGAGAILHEATDRRDRQLLAADRISGAAAYVGKHQGFAAGLMFRISSALAALFSGRISLFTSIVSGSRVDPT